MPVPGRRWDLHHNERDRCRRTFYPCNPLQPRSSEGGLGAAGMDCRGLPCCHHVFGFVVCHHWTGHSEGLMVGPIMVGGCSAPQLGAMISALMMHPSCADGRHVLGPHDAGCPGVRHRRRGCGRPYCAGLMPSCMPLLPSKCIWWPCSPKPCYLCDAAVTLPPCAHICNGFRSTPAASPRRHVARPRPPSTSSAQSGRPADERAAPPPYPYPPPVPSLLPACTYMR